MAHLAEVLRSLTADDPKSVVQGRRFERLAAAALRAHPGEYGRERFEEVWLWGEWPEREALGYGRDVGIDIVARQTPAYGGGWCAIQCKFHATEVPTAGVDSFLGASGTADFGSRLLIATARVSKTGMAKVRKAEPRCEVLHTSEMDRWVEDWRGFADTPDRLEIPPAPKHKLHGFQQDAVRDITKSFRDADRGQLILPCGTGKSLVALRAAEQVAGRGGRVLYLVPSIALIGQTMREWSRQREMPLRYLGVCSDVTAGRKATAQADTAGDLTELAIPVTTDPERLADELSRPAPPDAMQVVFSTYQSSPKIAEAQERAGGGWGFDLIICDEAHRTTGIEESKEGLGVSPFRIVHDDKHIRGRKRLYMTATPRVFTERQKKKIEGPDFEGDSYSMADAKTFGERFYEMEFSEAVEGGYLSDYEVLVITATEEAYLQSLANAGWSHEVLVQEGTNLALDDAVKLAGCWDALATPATTEVETWRLPGQVHAGFGAPASSAIAFANRVRTSQAVAEFWPEMVSALTHRSAASGEGDSEKDIRVFLGLDVNHIDGSTPAAERTDLLEQLREERGEGSEPTGEEVPTCRILSNARVLTEGVDVPSLDAVLFLNSRTSTVDITQAVGRAMRKAPGKRKGYIVIPVVVPPDVSPQEMLKASDFKTVWEVVRALRSHDSRMEYYVSNASAWEKNAPLRARIFGSGGEVDEAEEQMQRQLQLQLSCKIASMVVDTIGDKQMYPRWGEYAADICRQVRTRINKLIAEGGPAEEAFVRFLKGVRQSVGDHITTGQAQEMIAQHVVTIPVFNVMLADSGFAEQNPVSKEIEQLLDTFRELEVSFEEELRPLTRAYMQMEKAFEGAVSSGDKVDILREIYNGFFKAAMKDTVKRVGIVYTPVEIVDFMVLSVAAICEKEFGRSIGSENLHILDPFAGTGTFLSRLIEMKDDKEHYLISPQDLARKYERELHANEFVLLAYYIAALKIEEAKHSREVESSGNVEYETYTKILLTDTLLASPEQEALGVFGDNIRGRLRQDATPMTVVMSNPPWSSGQKSAGDDNPNLEYEEVGKRVEKTYGEKHQEVIGRSPGGNAMGNLYVKALRWCSDRVLPSEQRGNHPAIVGLVHPNSLTDGTSLAGVRATLRDEFTDIYVVNLRGNAYKSGDEFRKEGDKIFGGGSRNGVQITFLVRNPSKDVKQPANLHYAQVPDYMSLNEKWEWLAGLGDITNEKLETVPITLQHDWVNLSDGTFEEMISVCDTNKDNSKVIASRHARGVGTSCDDYVYSFSRDKLIEKIHKLIDAYDQALELVEDYGFDVEEVTVNTKLDAIKWTDTLKGSLHKGKRIVFDERRIREVLYRPFTKLWLYEDDRILSAVKTVSAMFPRDEDLSVITGGGGEFSSPVHPTWQSSESSQPGYTEISKPQGPPKPPESLPEGDSDQQRQQHDIPGTGHGVSPGPGGDQGLPADAGDAALGITGGGGGEFSSPLPPTRRYSESSLPGSSAISAQSGPSNLVGYFPGGDDVDGSVEHGPVRGAGGEPVGGFAHDGGGSADAGDPPPVTGGGGRAVAPGQPDATVALYDTRRRSSVRLVRHRPSDPDTSPALLIMKDPQLPFAVLTTRILPDLHTVGRPTRVLPRGRRS